MPSMRTRSPLHRRMVSPAWMEAIQMAARVSMDGLFLYGENEELFGERLVNFIQYLCQFASR